MKRLLFSLAPVLSRAERIAMIRAAHRRRGARKASAERFVRTVAPHLREERLTELPAYDALDGIARETVRVGGAW